MILPIQHEIAKSSRSKSLVQQKLRGENLSHYDHRDFICLFLSDYPSKPRAEGGRRRAASEASWGAALCFKFRSIPSAAVYRGCATVFGASGAILMLSGAILMPQWGHFDALFFVNIVNI